MSQHDLAYRLKPEDRPAGKPQERMSVDEYRKQVGAPPRREPVARIAMPEPTPQDIVAMAAKGWPAEKRICVEIPTPPGLNNAYENTGGNGRRKSAKLKKFYADATAALVNYGKRLDAETYRATILVTRENALSDIDGKAKFALDLLVKLGIIPDDRHCEKLTIEWRYLHAPGTTVVLDRYKKRRA
jgi:Holliday junction resolvase RusA-like endonuclease